MARSAQELRLESENTRAELTVTVEKLKERVAETAEDIRYRVSPEHLKSEASDLVRDKSQIWFRGLKQQAIENPMQAVAVGAVIAVPLLRLARGFPLPLLMIGAGVALTSKAVRDRAANAAAPALGKAGEILDETSERAEAFKSGLQDGIASVQSHAAGIGNDVAENIRSQAAQATHAAGDRIRAGVESAKNAAATAPAKARQVVGDKAALIGGLGIAIGAIIGAAFPESKAEAKAVGQASENVKRSANEAAQAGFETARDAIMSALDAAATKIAEADLGGQASHITQKMADTLEEAADDVERAAFNTSRNSNT